MGSERFAGIKLPAQYSQLVNLINERPVPFTPELRAEKAEELLDLYEAILSSPDYNAWRQSISPEAYQNPTAFGGTDPRDLFKDYVRFPPGATRQDLWIPRGGGPYDRMAADGMVYTFRDGNLARATSSSGYASLLGQIEHQVWRITNQHLPNAHAWEGEKLGAGMPLDLNSPASPTDHSTHAPQRGTPPRRPPLPTVGLDPKTPGAIILIPRPPQMMMKPQSEIVIPPKFQLLHPQSGISVPGALAGRLARARLGAQIHQWVDNAYRALENPDKKIPLPNGAYVIANRTIGGKMRPDVFYVDDNKKEFCVIDMYTGSKKEIFTPTGYDSKSHAGKGMDYEKEPLSLELKAKGYKYRGYFIAGRDASVPPNKLH